MKAELLLLDFEKKQITKFIGNSKIGLMIEMKTIPNLNKDGVEDLRTISMLDDRNPFKV